MEIYRAKNHLKAERWKLIDKAMAKPLTLALLTAVLGLCPKLTNWIVVILTEGFGGECLPCPAGPGLCHHSARSDRT